MLATFQMPKGPMCQRLMHWVAFPSCIDFWWAKPGSTVNAIFEKKRKST